MSCGRLPDRGQTTLDFTVGVSVFLAILVFVFGFVPTMFAPFESDTGSDAATANRVADRLSADVLADTTREPSVLNETCTVGFFDADGGPPVAGCRYGTDAADLEMTLGVDSFIHVNVTIENDSGTRLAAGEAPTSADDPVIAKRAVLLSDEQNRLFVRVW